MSRTTLRPPLSSAGCTLLLCLLGAVFAAAPAHTGPTAEAARAGFDPLRLRRIDARMQEAVDAGRMVGGEGVILRHGHVVYRGSWGMADREAQRPMGDDSIFRVYSMTKPITSVALLMLYEEGRFLLGDPVARYLPELADLRVIDDPNGTATRPAARQPTIRDLLRHTAGFTYGLFGDTDVDRAYRKARLLEQPTLAAFTRVLGTLPLLFDPGERWHYSVAVDVQGRLIEVLSGRSLGEFLEERIFEPLGMVDTGFRLRSGEARRLAQLYSPSGADLGWDRPWQFGDENALVVADPELSRVYRDGHQFESGGAGLLSTSNDYLRFARLLANDGALDGVRLLAPGTVDFMRRDHLDGVQRDGLWGMDGFGLGVGIVGNSAGRSGELGADGAYGWGGAAGTNFWIDPDNGIVGLFMVQSIPHRTGLATRFRVLTYQALVDADMARASDPAGSATGASARATR